MQQYTIGLGAFDPNCIKKDNCKPFCVEYFKRKYNINVPGWNYTGQPADEGCFKADNCKPQCIENFRSLSIEQQNQATQNVDLPQIQAAKQASEKKNLYLIGGAVVLAGVAIFLASSK